MYIHKSVYEALPYFYITASIVIFFVLDNPLIYFSAAALYCAGALVWVTRSAYRRKNSRFCIENRKGRLRFPERLYEFLPFIYLAIGVVIIVTIPGVFGLAPGGLFCLAGVLVWIIRAIYRSHPAPIASA
ncbi:MAG: hypothetical protein V7707_04635 [Motiliproteus sp.]